MKLNWHDDIVHIALTWMIKYCWFIFVDGPREASLVLILKWGGELTPAGKIQAEELGKAFRCMYPGGQGEWWPQGDDQLVIILDYCKSGYFALHVCKKKHQILANENFNTVH